MNSYHSEQKSLYLNLHQKIANGVISLYRKIPTECEIMPIGIDGGVLEHFLQVCRRKTDRPYSDYLNNIVQVSSKSGDIDSEKFENITFRSWYKEIPLYAVDMRTKTGSLGKILKDKITEIKKRENVNIDFKYAVVFDQNGKADVCGSREELSDEERPLWVDGEENVKKLIHIEGEKWKYDLNGYTIINFNHVSEITDEIWLQLS